MKNKVSQRGQSLVEFALLLPILVILLLGLLDLGRLFYAYVGVTGAAAEGADHGARWARHLDYDALVSEIVDRTVESTEGLVQIEEDQVAVAPEAIDESTDAITVTVTYPFELITPLVRAIAPDGVLDLRAVAVRDF